MIEDTSVFSLMERKLKEYKSSIELHLATGGAATTDKYWVSVGSYEAYNNILEDLKELEKRYIESQNFLFQLDVIRGLSAQGNGRPFKLLQR